MPNTNPINVLDGYLSRFSRAAQKTAIANLKRVARTLGFEGSIEQYPWKRLRYEHTILIRQRLAKTLAPSTANNTLGTLKGLLRECFRRGEMRLRDYKSAVDLCQVRGDTITPSRKLTVSEVRHMLQTCALDRSFRGMRDLAILSLCYYGALRMGELLRADVENVVMLKPHRLKVLGQNGKWGTVYLVNVGARKALRRWIRIRGSHPGPLFVSIDQFGNSSNQRMSRKMIMGAVRARGSAAGITGLHSSEIRAARGFHLSKTGLDCLLLMRVLRCSVNTALKYDPSGEAALRFIVRRYKS